MGADPSAYAVLGLEPGAELAAVEQAYRRLIKAHHPDRAGGDPQRAADLNRAYRELRRALLHRDDLSLHAVRARRAPGWSRTVWALVAAGLLGSAATAFTLLSPREAARMVGLDPPRQGGDGRLDAMERPPNLAQIDSVALEVVRLARRADEMALSARSNQCYREFRAAPSIDRFDRCAALDYAVVRLQDRDPLRDRGRFNDIAVTSRLWSAAALLSNDSVATDSRLRRVRLQVELLLTPVEPSSAAR